MADDDQGIDDEKAAAEWEAMMADSDISRKIDADQEANGPAFFNHLKERFGV